MNPDTQPIKCCGTFQIQNKIREPESPSHSRPSSARLIPQTVKHELCLLAPFLFYLPTPERLIC